MKREEIKEIIEKLESANDWLNSGHKQECKTLIKQSIKKLESLNEEKEVEEDKSECLELVAAEMDEIERAMHSMGYKGHEVVCGTDGARAYKQLLSKKNTVSETPKESNTVSAEEIRKQGIKIANEDVKKIIDFIKRQDKSKNPDADESENVVDIDCLRVPIFAGLIDAYEKGFRENKENNNWISVDGLEYKIKETDYLRIISLARIGAAKMHTKGDRRKAHNIIEDTHIKIGFKKPNPPKQKQ